jgi:hypothetical protein
MSFPVMILLKQRQEQLEIEQEESRKDPYMKCWFCDGDGIEKYVVKKRKFWFDKTELKNCHICNGEGKVLKTEENKKLWENF